ncbi:hypothetical protein F5Y08DRAFT_350704 [Xylaria arbuscula]|nr:hypothetical protein F5Y08DRAFT_350704 [Xylaria arbuscula]
MVSFKQLALLGTAISSICAFPAVNQAPDNKALRDISGTTSPVNVQPFARHDVETLHITPTRDELTIKVARTADEDDDLSKRVTMSRHVWWAPGGQAIFMLGLRIAELPAEIVDIITGYAEGVPGQLMLRNFYDYLQQTNEDVYQWVTEQLPGVQAQIGAIFGTGDRQGDFGFAFNVPNGLTNGGAGQQLWNMLIQAMQDWAGQGGQTVDVQQRANGFYDPTQIGAGPAKLKARGRPGSCPATNHNFLMDSAQDIPDDVAINTYYRWSGQC